MAQIFHRSSNTIALVSLFGVFVAPVGLILGMSGITRSPANTNVGIALEQPIPFSHEHHVTELGIDCRYCHTSVEKSASAGIPPTQTCMSCHSQIWTNSPLLLPVRESYKENKPLVWNRLNKVPDFVYFNHSIHVNRGINCNRCHGPVQKMMLTYKGNPFQMRWCLECHRSPEKNIYQSAEAKKSGISPREQVFDLYWKYQAGTKLSPREQSLADGFDDYNPSQKEVDQGEKLVEHYGVKTKQLADCSICHR